MLLVALTTALSSSNGPFPYNNPPLFVIPPAPACRGSVAEGSAVRLSGNPSIKVWETAAGCSLEGARPRYAG